MESSTLRMSRVIEYKRVFPQSKLTAKQHLAAYSRATIMKLISVLNSIQRRGVRDFGIQVDIWFGKDNPLGYEVKKLIYAGYPEEIRNQTILTLVSENTNLYISVIALQLSDYDYISEFDYNQCYLDFFKAYLLVNQDFVDRQKKISETLPSDLNPSEKAAWISSASLISYYDFSYFSRLSPVIQFRKALYCFDFLKTYNYALYTHLLSKKSVNGFEDYAVKLLPLVKLCLSDTTIVSIETDQNREFLDIYAVKADIENSVDEAEFDFISIRNQPLFRINEKDYVILNRAMVINKIYSSIYWDCRAILKSNPKLNISLDGFRIHFTSHFSEEYLFYKLMDKAYEGKSIIKYSGVEMKKYMAHSEPDYYIRNRNKVSIYEVKDSFISGPVKQSFDVSAIRAEIKKKYYHDSTSSKAVKQLIQRIEYSLCMSYPFDLNYCPNRLSIYPILLVYDINLTVPAVENLIVQWFRLEREDLVEKMATKGINGFRVNDIVILHIDSLILLSEYIKANKLQMELLVDQYLKRKRSLMKLSKIKTFSGLKSNVLNSYLSFNHYVMDRLNNVSKTSDFSGRIWDS